MIIVVIFLILSLLVSAFSFFAVWRLNKYIQGLEEKFDMQIDRVDGLQDIMRVAIKENYLNPDMTVNKPLIENEDHEE